MRRWIVAAVARLRWSTRRAVGLGASVQNHSGVRRAEPREWAAINLRTPQTRPHPTTARNSFAHRSAGVLLIVLGMGLSACTEEKLRAPIIVTIEGSVKGVPFKIRDEFTCRYTIQHDLAGDFHYVTMIEDGSSHYLEDANLWLHVAKSNTGGMYCREAFFPKYDESDEFCIDSYAPLVNKAYFSFGSKEHFAHADKLRPNQLNLCISSVMKSGIPPLLPSLSGRRREFRINPDYKDPT